MDMRNITFTQQDPAVLPSESAKPAAEVRLKLRQVSVSPHEEYQLREGEVRPISNELHAAILSRKGRAEITPKGIVVDRKDMGGKTVFWHEDSILCNDLAARERKIFYVVNPLQPDIVHLLSDKGAYIESLPAKFRPEVLNIAQQAAEAARQNVFISRAASRLQQLHGDATAEKIAALQANSVEMQRVVQTLPAPAGAPRHEAAPAAGAGRQSAMATRQINDIRNQRQSAVDLGRAISSSRSERYIPEPIEAEDWQDSSPSRHHQPNHTQTAIESW